MNKILCILAAFALLLTSSPTPARARSSSSQDTAGVWTFFVTFTGTPPCQCIQIGTFHADGSFDGPANDRLSGGAIGLWQQTGSREVTVAILQNNINPDGTAGGVYSIHSKLNLNATSDQGTGSGTVQLLDNGGNVKYSGTFTVKAVKLKL